MERVEPDADEPRPLLANAALLILALIASGVAAAFVLPWFSWSEPGGPQLARYAPLAQGAARLTADYDAAGAVTSWSTQNEMLLPPALAMAAETRKNERDAINKFFSRAGETGELPNEVLLVRMEGTKIYQSRTRRLAADGKTSDSQLLAIRDRRADYLVALYDPGSDSETTFDPPIPILESDLAVGEAGKRAANDWGRTASSSIATPRRCSRRRSSRTRLARLPDTLKVETRLVFTSGTQTLYDAVTNYWLAPGIGAVESQTLDAAGALKSRTMMLNATDQRMQVAALPPYAAVSGQSVTGRRRHAVGSQPLREHPKLKRQQRKQHPADMDPD
jgi:hypothetical protein